MARLGVALDYQFHDPALLVAALTHPSARGAHDHGVARGAHDHGVARGVPSSPDYQRLEFLGDRVVGLVVAYMLYRRFPTEGEGKLTRRHGALVRREALTRIAETLDLGPAILLAKGEEAAGGRNNPSTLADACEALFGAIFADGGFEAAARLIRRLWEPMLDMLAAPPRDAKTALQEWLQGRGRGLPIYQIEERAGPAHEPVFLVSVSVPDEPPAAGKGRSRREAEQAAAAALLERLGG